MSPSHVIEPTYQAIKQRLQSGDLPPGVRLEATKLAYDHNVSITPVRDSLHRLAGEQMVDFAHGEGFRAHLVTEAELRDMLGLNLILLLGSLTTGRRDQPVIKSGVQEYPHRLANLWLATARASQNDELLTAIARLNDRLCLARRLDASILSGTEAELDEIEAAMEGAEDVPSLLVRHHARRIEKASLYARLLSASK
ncbi:GntR family transcriptional regulator [Sphingopyxis indica]|nr:GntR family transcriptional regulator [Sphingopyxis indica]